MLKVRIKINSASTCLMDLQFDIDERQKIEGIVNALHASSTGNQPYALSISDLEVILIGAKVLQESVILITIDEKKEGRENA